MSTSDRAELLSRLGELSRACPEMRFGPLIANLAVVAPERSLERSGKWRMRSYWRP